MDNSISDMIKPDFNGAFELLKIVLGIVINIIGVILKIVFAILTYNFFLTLGIITIVIFLILKQLFTTYVEKEGFIYTGIDKYIFFLVWIKSIFKWKRR